jgi:hypothetical protein
MSFKIPYFIIYLLKKLNIYELSKKIYRNYFLYSGILKNDIESIIFYRSTNIKHGLFLDVGCYKGSKIDQFLNINIKLKIIGIEPFEKYFKKLVLKYKNFPNVEIYNYAISNNKFLKKKFFYNKKKIDKEAFSLIKRQKLDQFTYVKVYKLDNFITRKPQIVKIDTEGSEFSVIKGAKKIINKYRPIFFIEVTNLTLKKILREFDKNEYLVFVYEYTFFKKKLKNNWIKNNIIKSNIFEKKIYKPEDILKNTNKEYMFNLICFPKECEKIFEDLYNN